VAAAISLFPIAKNGISQKPLALPRQEPELRFLKRWLRELGWGRMPLSISGIPRRLFNVRAGGWEVETKESDHE
jgi:hypothetical protein